MTQLFAFMKRGTAQPAVDPMAAQRARVKALKEEALTQATRDAHAESRMPTLTDYFIACETLGEKHREALTAEQVQWGPKVYTDMSGLTIEGYLIRKEDLSPPSDMRARAAERAKSVAQHQGRVPNRLDILRAMKDELDAVLPVEKIA